MTWGCMGRLVTEHYLVNIDPETGTADCRGCGGRVNIIRKAGRGKGWGCTNKQQASAAEYRQNNSEEIQRKHKEWRDAHPGYRDTVRNNQLLTLYGVTLEEYDAEVARREGRCDICGQLPSGDNNTNLISLNVDHDHADGHIRGYLDANCNAGLGRFDDDPQRLAAAITYLKPSRTELTQVIEHLLRHLESLQA